MTDDGEFRNFVFILSIHSYEDLVCVSDVLLYSVPFDPDEFAGMVWFFLVAERLEGIQDDELSFWGSEC